MAQRSPQKPGWHPDPIGQRGGYRWWNGTTWTQSTSHTVWAPEPRHTVPYERAAEAEQEPAGFSMPRLIELEESSSSKRPLLFGIGALTIVVLAVLGAVAWTGVPGEQPDSSERAESGHPPEGRSTSDPSRGKPDQRTTPSPTTSPTVDPTPTPTPTGEATHGAPVFEEPGDGWVVGFIGTLPHGQVRRFVTEKNYHGSKDWGATLISGTAPDGIEWKGELSRTATDVGDWFATTGFGSEREPRLTTVDQGETTVADRPAYSLRVRIQYDIDGLEARWDDTEIVVIDLGAGRRPGMFLASVPDTNPELWGTANKALQSVSVPQ